MQALLPRWQQLLLLLLGACPSGYADHNCAACEQYGSTMGKEIDFPNNDIMQIPVKDATHCCQSCLISNECKMWVVSWPDQQTCWLKNGIHENTRVKASTRTSGLTCSCDDSCEDHGHMPGGLPVVEDDHSWGWVRANACGHRFSHPS
eukprot:COSAG01_NODE_7828_length_3038_cov_1.237155_5_plen_148_part_00